VKLFSKKKAKDIKWKVIVSIVLVLIPFIIRGTYTVLSKIYDIEDIIIGNSIENNTWAYPIFINSWYIVNDIIPVVAQIISSSIVIHDFKKSKLGQSDLENPKHDKNNDNSNKDNTSKPYSVSITESEWEIIPSVSFIENSDYQEETEATLKV
jgi:hypothetical protein